MKIFIQLIKAKFVQLVPIFPTKTRITIKNVFIIFFISLGVLASLSQSFVTTYPNDIEEARKLHSSSRNARDKNREDAFKVLANILENKNISLSKEESLLISNLIKEHSRNEKESLRLFDELKKVKTRNEIRGYKTLNSFLFSIGNPILMGVIGIFFLLMHLRRKKITWEKLSRTYFLSAAIICFSISILYLSWVLVNLPEIPRYWYIFIGLFCAIVIVYISKFVSKKVVIGKNPDATTVLEKFLKKGS